jgi:hypothetical protein
LDGPESLPRLIVCAAKLDLDFLSLFVGLAH